MTRLVTFLTGWWKTRHPSPTADPEEPAGQHHVQAPPFSDTNLPCVACTSRDTTWTYMPADPIFGDVEWMLLTCKTCGNTWSGTCTYPIPD